MNTNGYISPFSQRYASAEMSYIFSNDFKFSTWRKLWVALARCEKQLGIPIRDEQIAAMERHIYDIDYEKAAEHEKKLRHDVMAHVHTFGEQVPEAMPIIHLGATSAYVGDNTDLIQMRDALKLVRRKLVNCMHHLSHFALKHRNLPTLGYTHFQPAQLTTVGKRAALWLQDMLLDLQELEFRLETLAFRGVKGTTGTQASFMELFEGDQEKIRQLDAMVSSSMGFDKVLTITGQTYTRKQDTFVLSTLANIASTAHKMATDLRLLANLKEIEEPFEKNQIGSSAMAYKRNPMRSERVCALARFVMSNVMNPLQTHSTQWFERTLDDSANKRLATPEAFLATDSLLDILINICQGMVVYPKMIEKHLMAELPFIATENIMMAAVKKGGDRQEIHEIIRTHSIAAGNRVKNEGGENDLLQRLAEDPRFELNYDELMQTLEPARYVGRAPEQTSEFINEEVQPMLRKYADELGISVELKV
ncbi:adenylosuccinate lyase [Desulfurispira natronophila]|uniref:Adenylosuccinate lyase n=1 Tax=Desulfurispira natronophila TaxID=682562 RepID=A0A7W7Y4Z2_9BACT|nr:adenylosuccinate lyase [Desulfurispira natronophila]MBB5022102.1 adenylosuccinate lyase [Desulfurispira natronophila]